MSAMCNASFGTPEAFLAGMRKIVSRSHLGPFVRVAELLELKLHSPTVRALVGAEAARLAALQHCVGDLGLLHSVSLRHALRRDAPAGARASNLQPAGSLQAALEALLAQVVLEVGVDAPLVQAPLECGDVTLPLLGLFQLELGPPLVKHLEVGADDDGGGEALHVATFALELEIATVDEAFGAGGAAVAAHGFLHHPAGFADGVFSYPVAVAASACVPDVDLVGCDAIIALQAAVVHVVGLASAALFGVEHHDARCVAAAASRLEQALALFQQAQAAVDHAQLDLTVEDEFLDGDAADDELAELLQRGALLVARGAAGEDAVAEHVAAIVSAVLVRVVAVLAHSLEAALVGSADLQVRARQFRPQLADEAGEGGLVGHHAVPLDVGAEAARCGSGRAELELPADGDQRLCGRTNLVSPSNTRASSPRELRHPARDAIKFPPDQGAHLRRPRG